MPRRQTSGIGRVSLDAGIWGLKSCLGPVGAGLFSALIGQIVVPTVIRARRFEVVNAEGNTLANLATDDEHRGVLALLTRSGKKHSLLQADVAGRGALALLSENGEPHSALMAVGVPGSVLLFVVRVPVSASCGPRPGECMAHAAPAACATSMSNDHL